MYSCVYTSTNDCRYRSAVSLSGSVMDTVRMPREMPSATEMGASETTKRLYSKPSSPIAASTFSLNFGSLVISWASKMRSPRSPPATRSWTVVSRVMLATAFESPVARPTNRPTAIPRMENGMKSHALRRTRFRSRSSPLVPGGIEPYRMGVPEGGQTFVNRFTIYRVDRLRQHHRPPVHSARRGLYPARPEVAHSVRDPRVALRVRQGRCRRQPGRKRQQRRDPHTAQPRQGSNSCDGC